MMRRLVHVVFTLTLSLAGTGAVLAQDANKIIDEYLKAAGGNKSISRIKTVSIDGAFNSGAEAKPGTFTFRAKQPNRYYTEIQSEGKTLIESYNGKSAWHQAGNGEIATLLGPQALELEAAAEYYNARLQALAKRKIGAAFKGHAQVGGRDALQVELTYPTGVRWEVYFDPQTHLIVEEKATIAGIPRDILFRFPKLPSSNIVLAISHERSHVKPGLQRLFRRYQNALHQPWVITSEVNLS